MLRRRDSLSPASRTETMCMIDETLCMVAHTLHNTDGTRLNRALGRRSDSAPGFVNQGASPTCARSRREKVSSIRMWRWSEGAGEGEGG
eukprot:6201959-Pleurochrysis_carterae.AAC.1